MATLRVHESPNRRVLAAANSFHEAAMRLYAVDALTVPSVVNAALALELYLKCLDADVHFKKGRQKRGGAIAYDEVSVFANSKGHEPHKLFKALPQDTRKFLDAYFSKRFPLKREKLESTLEKYEGIFVGWRYLFEGKGNALDLSKLFELLKFLKHSTAEFSSWKQGAHGLIG